MKADPNLALIKRLKISERPVGLDAKGELVFEANVGNKPYILWDSPCASEIRLAPIRTHSRVPLGQSVSQEPEH